MQYNDFQDSDNLKLDTLGAFLSHELYAPLRSINGYSHILLDDYQNILDDEAKRYLGRIQQAAKTMKEILDDLIIFSHIQTVELSVEPVNLSEIFHTFLHSLRQQNPLRKVTCPIQKNILVYGDRQLLNLLLMYLIQNAWKFTEKSSPTRISFCMKQVDNQTIFFVRDNGVGFDEKYSGRLFHLFNRLHDPEEYPGKGISLAIAAQIIERHHGVIWAHGKPGKGATFYFTLNDSL
jgi:light-regulated signal transduction histidine kinase (bacteriophytochrome)